MSEEHRQSLTFWQIMADYPPCYVRLWAKHGYAKTLSDAEIAIGSGIDINRVRQINCLMSWDTVTFGEIIAYTLACNFDPTNSAHRRRVRNYENACRTRNSDPFQWLKTSRKYESEILPILKILKTRYQPQSSAA